MRRVVVALLHFPVLDRSGSLITTAITNIDIHDIARSACTYGITDVFMVHPISAQRELVERVRDHWLHGSGAKRIPDRMPPMQLLRIVESLEQIYPALGLDRRGVELWTTSAKTRDTSVSYPAARERLSEEGPPVVMLFGTGWGIAKGVIDDADVQLEPICSRVNSGFNHLSVRAACAISLDRLLGAQGFTQGKYASPVRG